MTMIYVLLVAHFVGDFICQTDWMAQNKSKRWDALALHVAVYSAVVYACLLVAGAFWAGWRFTTQIPLVIPRFLPFIGATFAAHFVQDAITSRINSRLWQANQ